MKNYMKIPLLTAMLALTLSACSDDDDDAKTEAPTQMYRISITNMTNAQPLSPPVAMLHDSSFSFWSIGMSASDALETMAEGGDGSALLSLQSDNPQHADSALLVPGATTEFTLNRSNSEHSLLSIAGMFVRTNDGFSGVNGVQIGTLETGDSTVFLTHVYDAGTEMNTEAVGTIPGVDSGEGFNASRDDVTSIVTLHSGVVSSDDGLSTSVLSEADRFDNPALKIEVTAL